MQWEPQRFDEPQDFQTPSPQPQLPPKKTNYLAIIAHISTIIVNFLVIMLLVSMMGVASQFASQLERSVIEQKNQETKWAQDKEYKPPTDINIDKFIGYKNIKEQLKEYIQAVKQSEIKKDLPRGILLYGPPGTGKSYLTKCLAGSVRGLSPFFITSGADFAEKYIGVGASRVRELFHAARKIAKNRGQNYYFIFIDEVDAIGSKRSDESNSQEHNRTLNALLTEIDGVGTSDHNPQAIIIAATNQKDMLDDALLREGRLGRHIELGVPDIETTKLILEDCIGNNINTSLNDRLPNIAKVIHQGSHFTPAQINALIKEAKKIASKKGQLLNEEIIYDARDFLLLGPESQDATQYSQEDQSRIAIHELGHAIIAKSLDFEIQRVTIKPRGKLGGYTIFLPKNDNTLLTQKDLIQNIIIALGGRAAEDEHFKGDVSIGCGDDLKKAFLTAQLMVQKFGMALQPELAQNPKPQTEQAAANTLDQFSSLNPLKNPSIDDTTQKGIVIIIDNCYKIAKRIISNNKSFLQGELYNKLKQGDNLDVSDFANILIAKYNL